jgi:hypothetical protein
MIKRFCAVALLIMVMGTMAIAQSDESGYKSAIGVRLAPGSYYDFFALSYKTFINTPGALEFNVGVGSKAQYIGVDKYNPFGLSISASYQHHFNIPVEGLRWYIGGGLTGYNAFSSNGQVNGFGFGFFPTGGIDWKIPNIFLNLSADFRPTIFFTRPDYYDSFHTSEFGISARYTLGARY